MLFTLQHGAQKTAEELLTKRADLKDIIHTSLSERLKTYNAILDDVSIVDLDFFRRI